MREIIIKRNELRDKSIKMRSIRFQPNITEEAIKTIEKEQTNIYNKWNFYDKFIKAREEVKNED